MAFSAALGLPAIYLGLPATLGDFRSDDLRAPAEAPRLFPGEATLLHELYHVCDLTNDDHPEIMGLISRYYESVPVEQEGAP